MTTAISLAGPEDTTRVLDLMSRYHDEAGLPHDDAHRQAVAEPLLSGSPLGAVWLIGPQRAPLGYVLLTFGWSVHLGGMIGHLAEAYIRPSVRNRGIGTEVIHAVAVSLRDVGLKALHADLADAASDAARFCRKVGFHQSAQILQLTDPL